MVFMFHIYHFVHIKIQMLFFPVGIIGYNHASLKPEHNLVNQYPSRGVIKFYHDNKLIKN